VEEGYDYIQGSRYMKGGKWGNTPFYRVLLSKVFFLFSSLLVGKRFTDFTNGFRAYTKEFIKDERININQEWLNAYELEPYLHCKAVTLGYRVKEVPVTKIYPNKKTSKIRPFIDWWKIIRPVIYLKLRIKK
jgi:dolichol-phosphate mannosyltransferase